MFVLNCKGRVLKVDKPLVMGVINLTPDSFYDGGKLKGIDAVLLLVEKMLNEGASIVDIGGQSTRPESERISDEEELKRVIDPLQAIHRKFPEAFISIDTFYSRVALEAVNSGACIVNDISAGSIDENLIKTVSNLKVPYVLMHMKGSPQTMQQEAHYENVSQEVFDFLIQKKDELHKSGIDEVIIDPGFGFGKTIQQNFQLLHRISLFKDLNCPILVGLSRKSTVYKTLGISADDALNGTTVLNTIALLNGASILRVHDVKEAVESVRLVEAYRNV